MINRQELIKTVESEIKRNADLFKNGDLSYEELHSEQYSLFKIIEDLKGYTKIYAILYNSYEFDDVNYGELQPIYFSLSKEKRDNEFLKILNKSTEHFNKFKKDDDYIENTNTSINYSVDNHSYHYESVEYNLE